MMTTVIVSEVLAETGSDVAPWLIGAGVIIVLGAIALIVARLVRGRRDAAAGPASAATVTTPTPAAPPSPASTAASEPTPGEPGDADQTPPDGPR